MRSKSLMSFLSKVAWSMDFSEPFAMIVTMRSLLVLAVKNEASVRVAGLEGWLRVRNYWLMMYCRVTLLDNEC